MASILKAGRRVALWCSGVGLGLYVFTPVVVAEKTGVASHIRPSQLSIYDEPEDLYDISYHMSEPGHLQEGVSVVRKEVTGVIAATKEVRDQASHIYQTGKAHTAGQINHLLDEENIAARAGAVAVGGLLGLLMGARRKGGLFKKLVYTTAGAGATTAALYPQHTRQYSNELVTNATTYATVSYNFLVGVKPQQGSSPDATPSPAPATVEKSLESEPKDRGASSTAAGEAKDVRSATTGRGKEVEGDYGQSNPDDANMYTTRS